MLLSGFFCYTISKVLLYHFYKLHIKKQQKTGLNFPVLFVCISEELPGRVFTEGKICLT